MPSGEPLDTGSLRRALGAFPTGVTVVTARASDGTPIGMTANSFTSVSLDPPLVLVCVGSGSSNFATFATAAAFTIHVLSEGQDSVASQFARRSADRFAGLAHHEGANGSPRLAECLAWFECTLHERVVAGDHVILIGRVEAFASGAGAPLGFSRGRYAVVRESTGSPEPVEAVATAYLVERDGLLLLRAAAGQTWSLPTARRPKVGIASTLDDAPGIKLRADEIFIYSIYEDAEDGRGVLVYRAHVDLDRREERPPDADGRLRWFDVADLPWGQIRSAGLLALLRRYVRERVDGRFGIYVDTPDGGRVAMIHDGPGS